MDRSSINDQDWTIAPKEDLVEKAIDSQDGKFLIAKWDAFLSRENVSEIPIKYARDRMWAPGEETESRWAREADKIGMRLVGQDEADRIRERLGKAVPGVDPEMDDVGMQP